MLTKRTSTEHCQPEPSPRSDGAQRRERKRIKVEVERLRVGPGEPSSYVWPLNKRGKREKRVCSTGPALYSQPLFMPMLFQRSRAGGLPGHQTRLQRLCVYLCLLDLPSPTEHLKQETHESHMSAPPNTHALSHTHTHAHSARTRL